MDYYNYFIENNYFFGNSLISKIHPSTYIINRGAASFAFLRALPTRYGSLWRKHLPVVFSPHRIYYCQTPHRGRVQEPHSSFWVSWPHRFLKRRITRTLISDQNVKLNRKLYCISMHILCIIMGEKLTSPSVSADYDSHSHHIVNSVVSYMHGGYCQQHYRYAVLIKIIHLPTHKSDISQNKNYVHVFFNRFIK